MVLSEFLWLSILPVFHLLTGANIVSFYDRFFSVSPPFCHHKLLISPEVGGKTPEDYPRESFYRFPEPHSCLNIQYLPFLPEPEP